MKTASLRLFMAIAVVVSLFAPKTLAGLNQVNQNQFGASTLHELFNEPIDANNSAQHPNKTYTNSMVIVGTNGAYTFTNTGVTMVAPIPNTWGDYLPIISVVKGNQNWSFGTTYGALLEDSGLIPGGTGAKFLLETGSSSVQLAPIELTFPGEGASKVGGYWIMSGNSWTYNRIQVDAYGATNNWLGQVLINPTTVANWGQNFYGFADDNGEAIFKIAINYYGKYYGGNPMIYAGNPGVADLMFEPVPEPGTIILLAMGCVSLTLRHRQQRRRKRS